MANGKLNLSERPSVHLQVSMSSKVKEPERNGIYSHCVASFCCCSSWCHKEFFTTKNGSGKHRITMKWMELEKGQETINEAKNSTFWKQLYFKYLVKH